MSRQLPIGRRKLRGAALAMLPVYLVLWIAGTGCLADLLFFEAQLSRCYYVVDLLSRVPLSPGSEFQLIDVMVGVDVTVPEGEVSVHSSTAQAGADVRLVQSRAGQLAREIDMRLELFSGSGLFGSTRIDPPIQLMSGDRLALFVLLDQLIGSFYGDFNFAPLVPARIEQPTFRFPDTANRAKFTTVFDAEFGIGYDLTEGELVFDGSVAVPADSRAKVPRKVIVEVAHLDANGKVQSRHKQIVKIKRKTGEFKTSRKAFNGIELEAGERVRVRMKPKGGDLTGLDWTLAPTYNFAR